MQVTFVALQTNGKETREQHLFTEEYAIIYVGRKVKTNGTLFQISELQWINRPANQLKAICKEFRFTGQNDNNQNDETKHGHDIS